ncbi:hypothetical protein BJ962_006808 [Streptomyces aureorectus]|nr:hypothetical protein [Streptomyces calvus]
MPVAFDQDGGFAGTAPGAKAALERLANRYATK